MLITKNKQKELIKYIEKQFSEISDIGLCELISCIDYTFKEMHENKSNSKRFSIESSVLDFWCCINIHSGRIEIATWRPSECPEFKYLGLFPSCAKAHIIYLDEN